MRGILLVGLVAFVGCGASQAAAPATEAIVASAPVEVIQVAAAALGAPIDPTTFPSAIEATIAGVPGLDGTYLLPHDGCTYGVHTWQTLAPGLVECSKCRASTRALWFHRRVPYGTGSANVVCLIEGHDQNRMQFGVIKSDSFKVGPSVVSTPNDGTFPFAGGTVTIRAVP